MSFILGQASAIGMRKGESARHQFGASWQGGIVARARQNNAGRALGLNRRSRLLEPTEDIYDTGCATLRNARA